MSRAFEYRPKFFDIRVRPPKPGEEEGPRADDVNRLKPGQRRCEHADCLRAAEAKAPKSRDLPGQYYHFCQPHAAEYNKNWNFYAGMNEGQIRAEQEREKVTGGRPTWSMKADAGSREAAAAAARDARNMADPFGLFRAQQRKAESAAAGRAVGKLERQALADMDLDVDADAAAIRARYKDLLKRCHPDMNGGDRSAEHKLQRVIKAYKTLQKSGMAK
ncbi:molecular chaperone DnaJ [Caulobacter sp. D4A]|uniref:J domain-containing protein n=1 Tax=unclassified Caulobacter TaxID=2648921 RepID=UPI000D738611|nr:MULTISPECIES: J domain-containing protein [unclassified Caulobacter]PXA79494.1 molecular chaperone DnaJ [Caulobacter sp. D4A]PXA88761.1 molecular chaperone DnaJ [Caulobacter sp. D5]